MSDEAQTAENQSVQNSKGMAALGALADDTATSSVVQTPIEPKIDN